VEVEVQLRRNPEHAVTEVSEIQLTLQLEVLLVDCFREVLVVEPCISEPYSAECASRVIMFVRYVVVVSLRVFFDSLTVEYNQVSILQEIVHSF
jgi:hypothetical protein